MRSVVLGFDPGVPQADKSVVVLKCEYCSKLLDSREMKEFKSIHEIRRLRAELTDTHQRTEKCARSD